MSWLQRLAGKALGTAPALRPRARSRYEPVEPGPLPMSWEEPAAAAARDEHTAAAAQTAAATEPPSRPMAATPRVAAAADRDVADSIASDAHVLAPRVTARHASDEPQPAPVAKAAGLTAKLSPPSPAGVREPARHHAPTGAPLSQAAIAAEGRAEPPLSWGRPLPAPPGPLRPPRQDGIAPAPRAEASVERHVHVSIGRVEVHAAAQPAAPRPRPQARGPELSLDDYLNRRPRA